MKETPEPGVVCVVVPVKVAPITDMGFIPAVTVYDQAAHDSFRHFHPDIGDHFDAGPAGIVEWAISSGLLHRATVTNLFEFLLKRDMNLDPSDPLSEVDLLSELTAEFESQDNFKQLVKRIVQLPQYRRMP